MDVVNLMEAFRLAPDETILADTGQPIRLTDEKKPCQTCRRIEHLVIRKNNEPKGTFCKACKRLNTSYTPMGTCEGTFLLREQERPIFFRRSAPPGARHGDDDFRNAIPLADIIFDSNPLVRAILEAVRFGPPFALFTSVRGRVSISSVGITEDLRCFRVGGAGFELPRFHQSPVLNLETGKDIFRPTYDRFDWELVDSLRHHLRELDEKVIEEISSHTENYRLARPIVSWEEIIHIVSGDAPVPDRPPARIRFDAIKDRFSFDRLPILNGPEHAILNMMET